jgi:hypothetical protein
MLSLKQIDLSKAEQVEINGDVFYVHKDIIVGDGRPYLAYRNKDIICGEFEYKMYSSEKEYHLVTDYFDWDLDELDELYKIVIGEDKSE